MFMREAIGTKDLREKLFTHYATVAEGLLIKAEPLRFLHLLIKCLFFPLRTGGQQGDLTFYCDFKVFRTRYAHYFQEEMII